MRAQPTLTPLWEGEVLDHVTKAKRFFWAEKGLQKDSPGCTAPLIQTFPLAGLPFPAPWAPTKSSCSAMEQLCCSPQAGDYFTEMSCSSASLGHPHPHQAAMPELPYHNMKNRATQAVNFIFISFCSARCSGAHRMWCEGKTPGSISCPSPLFLFFPLSPQ